MESRSRLLARVGGLPELLRRARRGEYYVKCSCCEYHSLYGTPKEKAIAVHNSFAARLSAAEAMAEALEPLARAGENWFPQTTDAEPIGYEANHATDADKDALFLTVGHARAAQRALAAWRAAQNSQPAPGAEVKRDEK